MELNDHHLPSSSLHEQPSHAEDDNQSPDLAKLSPNPLPLATLSLSLSSLLSSHLHLFSSSSSSKSPPSSRSPFHSHLKIPSQLSVLSLNSSSSTSPSKPPSRSSHSNFSSSLLVSPFTFLPRRPADPAHGAAARRCTIVWFRADLRLHDNEALSAASNDSLSLLPVYFFDPRDYGKSSSGLDKTGPYRARFLLEAVADLRRAFRDRGSDLVVRIGRPEVLLPELARSVSADAVYSQREVSHDEVRAEERVSEAMEAEGVEVKYFWGSTLYHIDDLPFDLEQMPSNYGGFRERVKGVAVRNTIGTPEDVKGLPSRGGVEPGDIPSLQDLGLNLAPTVSQDGKPVMTTALVGGETEALERLKKFAAECRAQPNKNKDGTQDSIYGANFSCKISPWLATGCLSPRFMFDELKKNATRTISASSQKNSSAVADNGMNWLMFELLWRDFFRFITKKYSTAKKANSVPVTACTGALA